MNTERRRLPKKRRSAVQAARIDGHRIYVTEGTYSDGSLGEIWLDMHKVGSFGRGMLHCFAKLFSIALQYGVPLRVLVKTFRGVHFSPDGAVTGHENISEATSIIDYVVHTLELDYPKDCEPYERKTETL